MRTRKLGSRLAILASLTFGLGGPLAAASLTEYAGQIINEERLSASFERPVSLSIIGTMPAYDRTRFHAFLSSFVFATGRPASETDAADADFTIAYAEQFSSFLRQQNVHPRLASVVERNVDQLRIGGPCTKIIAFGPSGVIRYYVFMALDIGQERREACLYAHARSLFGLREAGQYEAFADTFVADVTIARCIQKVVEREPRSRPPSELKAAVVRALDDRSCGP